MFTSVPCTAEGLCLSPTDDVATLSKEYISFIKTGFEYGCMMLQMQQENYFVDRYLGCAYKAVLFACFSRLS
jgi:hypothetical protein